MTAAADSNAEQFWASLEGKAVVIRVANLAQENDWNPEAAALKAAKRLPDIAPETARRALEIVFTRRKAAYLGPWASEGLFTYQSLEQASRPEISARHAQRFAGCSRVLEIGTGIGSDTSALARVAKEVVTLEKNPHVAAMAAHNFRVQGLDNITVLALDAEAYFGSNPDENFDGLWADPARRDASGKRLYSPEGWSPPLSFVLNSKVRGTLGIKISPGSDLDPLPDGVSREWIGFGDECLEQTLWRSSDVVDGTVWLADIDFEWVPPAQNLEAAIAAAESAAGGILVEPHAALIRSTHLERFYAQNGISLFDRKIAYGFSRDTIPPHALFTRYQVIESFPFSVGTLNHRLQHLRWSTRSEVKKRGFHESADELRKKFAFLSTKESEAFGVIILARLANDHFCFLAQRL